MIIRELTTHLSVADQLTLDDLETVKEAGFRSVICNRPDEEGDHTPRQTRWHEAPNALGLGSVIYQLTVQTSPTPMWSNMPCCFPKYQHLF